MVRKSSFLYIHVHVSRKAQKIVSLYLFNEYDERRFKQSKEEEEEKKKETKTTTET